jgi:predicted DNA-binding transcriptional regulator YafY
MPRIPEENIAARQDRILSLLRLHREGLTEQEIAKKLNLERRTVNNYLRDLEYRGWLFKDGPCWVVGEHIILRKFDLQPEEAIVLYLAARLFVKHQDQRNEPAESALLKLAEALRDDAGLGSEIVEAAKQLAHRSAKPGYQDVFRTVIRGYVHRRKVQIVYHPYRSKPFETTISPYLLEPSAIGFTTYVICHSSIVNSLRTYRMDRIEQASVLNREEFTVPPDFPGLELLRNAWSIYYGDEVVRVVLRFHPDVARRVQETIWHPSQQVSWDKRQPGYLLLTVEVADTTDLKPWVRTWGATCEVLEPAELRDEMMGEARKLAHLYGWKTTTGDDPNRPGPDHSRFRDIFGR